MKTLKFSDGDEMPIVGLGTWKSAPGEVYAAVREAIRVGYRHIDCAFRYGNEAEIGAALRDAISEGLVTRQDLWITSKLWNNSHGRENVEKGLKKSLEDLGLEYLDLYLIHWPIPLPAHVVFPSSGAEFLNPEEVPLSETWEGMEAAVSAGLTRHIGVSNFSIKKLSELVAHSKIKPEVNQVELHPFLQQKELVAYCQSEGIQLTAYAPLGSADRPAFAKAPDAPVLLENPVIQSIAQERGCTPAQVLIAWSIHRGISVIPKSVSPIRLQENLAAAEVELTQADMQRIAELDQNYRFIMGQFWAIEGSPWSLQTLWDEA